MKDLLVFLAEGFEEVEALTVVDLCRRAGLTVVMVSINDRREVEGSHGITVLADQLLDEINFEDYRGLYIPGGLPGATNLKREKRVVELVKIFAEEEKLVSAICAGPQVLDEAKVLQNGKFTCYPGVEEKLSVTEPLDVPVHRQDNIYTGMGPALAVLLGIQIVKHLAGEEKAQEVSQGFLVPKLVDFCKRDMIL